MFVHFHSYPILSHASRDKVREIVEHLTKYQLRSHLYFVAFGELQQQIVMTVPPPLRIVLYRRLMMRISERLATEVGAKALVTGESVGQVASQTLENLAVISNVVSELPILRPLIGSDKNEISDEGISIGTYPISIIPDQDCCQLFTPRNPATKARLRAAEMAEQNLPIDQLITAAIENVEHEDFKFPTQNMRRVDISTNSSRVASTR